MCILVCIDYVRFLRRFLYHLRSRCSVSLKICKPILIVELEGSVYMHHCIFKRMSIREKSVLNKTYPTLISYHEFKWFAKSAKA